MKDSVERELIDLVEAMIDKSATMADRERLESLLRDDREAQVYYAEQCQLHTMLAWEHGVLPELVFPDEQNVRLREAQQATSARMIRNWRRLTIAAIFLLFCSLLLTAINRPSDQNSRNQTVVSEEVDLQVAGIPWEQRDIIGTIVQSFGATLSVPDAQISLSQGDVARTGVYELKGGIVELGFNTGVDVIIEAPCRFKIESSMRMVLSEGSLSAKVAPAGEGFIVDTPSASVVDFGTEFGIEVFADKSSEVHVFEGEVDVKPRHANPNASAVKLRTDHATRIDKTGVIPQSIDIDHERFIRELSDPNAALNSYAQLVTSFAPTVYLRMEIAEDGKTILDMGSTQSVGTINTGTMIEPPFAPGIAGGSLRFGGPQRRAYAWIDAFPKSATQQLTVCAWVRAESRPRWAAIAKHWAVELIDNSSVNKGLGGQFHFGLNHDEGELEVQVRDKNNMIVGLRDIEPLPLHQWQHVAFVVDGSELTLYRNGKSIASTTCDGLAVDGPDRLGIAAKLSPNEPVPDQHNPGFWQGRIDELAIFDKALTAKDVGVLSNIQR
ncbi:LamG-like jellyroll fold domain-containing protein [Neorhodopirellula pilleata]|uniref:FecR protein n=1 Tax=Neorhodopirellula pilleata TaxID=2714738 RepID=A0A5C6ADL8_9BACT|nr:LamG-like jellyroll fold domain-containing protein [Neorhodopirellula pilleata]TWT96343.1 FecR protein [Neorhodopirellula pilleata]